MRREAEISSDESNFISYLRGVSIFIIVFGHVGGFWFYRPYSEFLHVFVPVFFFLSGAVSYLSFSRSPTIGRYYKKRIIGILVPYYALCIWALTIYILQNGSLPSFSLENLWAWLTINPSKRISPFNVGQVWFLHTLLIILLLSPLYFSLYDKHPYILLLVVISLGLLPLIQHLYDIDDYFYRADNNLFKPLVHSLFFIFGFVYFTSQQLKERKTIAAIMIGSLIIAVFLAIFLKLNIDYSYHTYAPDMYYVAGSFSAICAMLLLQQVLLHLCESFSLLRKVITFFYRHTFSVFLIHSFAIYMSELFIPSHSGSMVAGVQRLIIVLLFTSALAVPYSKMCNLIIAWLTEGKSKK